LYLYGSLADIQIKYCDLPIHFCTHFALCRHRNIHSENIRTVPISVLSACNVIYTILGRLISYQQMKSSTVLVCWSVVMTSKQYVFCALLCYYTWAVSTKYTLVSTVWFEDSLVAVHAGVLCFFVRSPVCKWWWHKLVTKTNKSLVLPFIRFCFRTFPSFMQWHVYCFRY
jgi:hypothetical protein